MVMSKEDKVKIKKTIILDALKRCLQRDVYSRITVQDIADEAGFSKGGVLHYYATKEDIYLELIEEIFTKLEMAQKDILESDEETRVMAPLSALLGVESFILDKSNVRIVVNLILYAFEEEKIMNPIRDFIYKHKLFYSDIINKSRTNITLRRKSDLKTEYLSRIVQTILMFIGILELIDPTDIDFTEIVTYVTSILKI